MTDKYKTALLVGADADGVAEHLRELLQLKLNSMPGSPFVIGLSGGSLPKFFAAVAPKLEVDWEKVKFIFCDERLVPYDHPDSTYRLYKYGELKYKIVRRRVRCS